MNKRQRKKQAKMKWVKVRKLINRRKINPVAIILYAMGYAITVAVNSYCQELPQYQEGGLVPEKNEMPDGKLVIPNDKIREMLDNKTEKTLNCTVKLCKEIEKIMERTS